MSRTTKRPYTGAKDVDTRCRGGGSCSCHIKKSKRKSAKAEVAYQEYIDEAYSQSRPHTDVI